MDSRTLFTGALSAALVIAVGFAGYYFAVARPQQQQAEMAHAATLAAQSAPVAEPSAAPTPVSELPQTRRAEPAPAPVGDMEDVIGDGEIIDEPGEIAPDRTMADSYVPPPVRSIADDEGMWVVNEYLERQSGNNIGWILQLYGSRVRYYAKGRVGQGTIRADKQAYFGRWPSRTNRLASGVRIDRTGSGTATLHFDFDFTVSGGSRRRAGRAWTTLDVADDGSGSYRIVGERGGVY